MTTCLRKSCSFSLLCVSFVNIYQSVCCSPFPFSFEGAIWDLFVFLPDHCLSIYFAYCLSVNPPESKIYKEPRYLIHPVYRIKTSMSRNSLPLLPPWFLKIPALANKES